MSLAPIALFVYNRPSHARQTIDALKSNRLARDSELFIFSDAPKNKRSECDVRAVRDYLKTVEGFKRVCICENKENLGPSRSIIAGVRDVIDRYGKIIVLEDDLTVSQYFLNFMNDALLLYEDEARVVSICGYMYPIKTRIHKTLFLRIPDCWGWATWKRGWELFDPDANRLLEQLKSRKMTRKFNLNGGYNFLRMLRKQSKSEISSWAICWYASSLLNDKLSLHPAKSLVRNVGFGDSGTHPSYDFEYCTDILQERILIAKIPVKEDRHAIRRISVFFKINWFKKLCYIARNMFTSRLNRG